MLAFENVCIDRTVINQTELDIDDKIRSNLFAWNGQFSPQFIEVMLRRFAHASDIIVDPFAGSGTTLCEAARQGIDSYGMELNPSAYYMAKTYEIVNLTAEERNNLVNRIQQIVDSVSDDDDEILEFLMSAIHESTDPALSNLLCTLVILLDLFNNKLFVDILHKKWGNLKNIISQIPYSPARVHVDMGDARQMHCAENEASLLLTSPPYINVFNYHQKYRRSVEALGYDVLKIAKKEFGSNRKNRGNRLLTVIQYCIDMALSLKEAIRVCESGARMIYVVGRESSVLGYSFCNSQLIYEIATEIFELPFLLRQERVFKNRYGQLIYEDILHFENSKEHYWLADEAIENAARNIAIRMLTQKATLYPDSKNIEFVHDAIKKSNKVKKSEK